MFNAEKKLFVITTNDNELYFVARSVDEKTDIPKIIGSMFNSHVYGVIKHGEVEGIIITDDGSMYIEKSFVAKFIDLCIQRCSESTMTLSSKNIKTINLFELQEEN